MLNEKDIYTHLKNGGSIEDLQKALENEIAAAQDRIIKEKDAELKKMEAEKKIGKARAAAHKAMMAYFTLVNPDINDDIVASVLDTLGTVEIRINGVAARDGKVFFTDEEMEKIWNTLFPVHFRKK